MTRTAVRHRLFFALTPGPETLEAICSVQYRLAPGRGRAVPAERLHATLLFLGDQSSAELTRLVDAAGRLEFQPCTLALDRLGHFPRAAVVWLGPSRIPPELPAFQERLSAAVASLGIVFDSKPWRMHLTLYRDLRRRPERIDFEPVEWQLNDFCLMESVQSRKGLQYVRRGRWPASYLA